MVNVNNSNSQGGWLRLLRTRGVALIVLAALVIGLFVGINFSGSTGSRMFQKDSLQLATTVESVDRSDIDSIKKQLEEVIAGMNRMVEKVEADTDKITKLASESFKSRLVNQPTLVTPGKKESKKFPDRTCCDIVKKAGKDRYESKRNRCYLTCGTRSACEDDFYPYSSSTVKEQYPRFVIENRKEFKRYCESAKTPTKPTCTRYFNQRKPQLDEIPIGCSNVHASGYSGAFMHMYFVPDAKFAFCGIPKVGITQWLHFIRFVNGANDYLSMPYYKDDVNSFRLDKLSKEKQLEILESSEWTKAIFIRNPADRLLSCYLDKVLGDRTNYKAENKTFAGFVDWLDRNGTGVLGWESDPHYRPQVLSCGLYQLLPYFQFVGTLEKISSQVITLLKSVNLWESHGKKFSTRKPKGDICNYYLDPLKPGETETGFQQRINKDGSSNDEHAKHAKSLYDQHYTPEILTKVERLYAMDFRLWELLQQPERSTAKGANGAELEKDFCSNRWKRKEKGSTEDGLH